MGKKGAVFLAILALALGIFFVKSALPPSEDELLLRYLSMSKWEKATAPLSFADEIPFPIPIALISLFGQAIAFSPVLFRLPNYLVSMAGLAVLYMIARRSKSSGVMPVTMLVLSPWFLFESMFDLPSALTLTLAMTMYLLEVNMEEKTLKWLYLIFLMGFIALSSFSGPVFGGVFFAWKFFGRSPRNKRWVLAGLLLFVWIFGIIKTNWWSSPTWFFKVDDLSLSTQGELVDQRARYEFKINNYANIIPLPIKRIVYNKFYFGYRAIVSQAAKVLDLEKWSFPGQSVATVSRSLWGSKGLPWLLFWQIIAAIWAIKYLNHEEKQAGVIFLSWALLSMMFSTERNFLGPGVGIVVPMALWSAKAVSGLDFRKFFVLGILFLWGVTAHLYHFAVNEIYWGDTRPQAFMAMAQMAVKHRDKDSVQVTTMIGRSFLYYAWTIKLPPKLLWEGLEKGNIGNVFFDHFELKETAPIHSVYIGFPGEFIGSKQLDNSFNANELPGKFRLLEAYKTHDSLSFGNGDYIWSVETSR
jgi:hypothetical protein